MSVSGILSSSFSNCGNEAVQNGRQQFQQEFQQLGQDLQAGNLSAAQSDFATLTGNAPQNATGSQDNSPIAQAFNQLSQDLQSGNLSAAQQDYSTIQQDFQSRAGGHHHHHHSSGSGDQQNPVAQLLSQLGQALQSGDLTSAQQAYSSLQQDFKNFAASGNPNAAGTSQSNSTGLQVTA